jgi:hypothetical protein
MKLRNLQMVLVLIISLLSGCSSKQGSAFEMTNVPNDCVDVLNKNNTDTTVCELVKDHQIIFLSDIDDSMMLIHTMYNNSNAAVLQMAAQYTLKKGDNYFAIAYPNKISNYEGSMIHLAKEFFEQCDIHIGNFVMFNTNPCGIYGNKKVGQIGIVTFKEKPTTPLTYNANHVIDALVQEGRFTEELKFTRFGILGGQ